MIHKPLYVLDLDRTLVDTDKFVELLSVSLKQQGHDGNSLVDKIEKARISENDINVEKAVESLGIGVWESVKKYFLEQSKEKNFLFEDAEIFLQNLKYQDLPHIILTFGISEAWQQLKLITAGLEDIPAIVSTSRKKSKTINSWRSEKGIYAPPGFSELSADKIILIDDRPGAFLEITSSSFKGYLLDRQSNLMSQSDFPAQVSVISSLSEIDL